MPDFSWAESVMAAPLLFQVGAVHVEATRVAGKIGVEAGGAFTIRAADTLAA